MAASRSFYDATLPPLSHSFSLLPLPFISFSPQGRCNHPVSRPVLSSSLHPLTSIFPLSLPTAVLSLSASLVPLPFTTVLIYTARYAWTSRCSVVLPGVSSTSSARCAALRCSARSARKKRPISRISRLLVLCIQIPSVPAHSQSLRDILVYVRICIAWTFRDN